MVGTIQRDTVNIRYDLKKVRMNAPVLSESGGKEFELFRSQLINVQENCPPRVTIQVEDTLRSKPRGGPEFEIEYLVTATTDEELNPETMMDWLKPIWRHNSLIIAFLSKLGGNIPLVLPPVYQEGKHSICKIFIKV